MSNKQSLYISPIERSNASILIVESDSTERNNMRACLQSLGFGELSDAANHVSALEKIDQRRFTHVIFNAVATNMPVTEFVMKSLECWPKLILIPMSFEPEADNVFDMLIAGARGFLVKPFNPASIDESIVNATKGERLAECVLKAEDRNSALAAILMQSLDNAALTIKQSAQFETAQREVSGKVANMYRIFDLVRTFSKGGVNGYLDALQKFCINRSSEPASQLGRLRKFLHNHTAAK